jgi:hypothetical protein
MMDRAPKGERPERYRKLADIKAARERGIKIPKPDLTTSRAKEILRDVNNTRVAEGKEPITMEELDSDLLIEEVFVCPISWKVIRTEPESGDGQPTYSWSALGEPCGQATLTRDGCVRHFRECHIAQRRPRNRRAGRSSTKGKNTLIKKGQPPQ